MIAREGQHGGIRAAGLPKDAGAEKEDAELYGL